MNMGRGNIHFSALVVAGDVRRAKANTHVPDTTRRPETTALELVSAAVYRYADSALRAKELPLIGTSC